MKKTNTIVEAHPLTLAEQLFTIEEQIAFLEERKQEARDALFKSLKSQGVKRVDLENGVQYLIKPTTKLVIKSELSAKKWALENPEARMNVSRAAVTKVAKEGKIKWAQVEHGEQLTINKKHSDENVTDTNY